MLVTAPASLREALDGRSTSALVAACARLRPDQTALADPVHATKAALVVVAQRIQLLDQEVTLADQRLATLVGRAKGGAEATGLSLTPRSVGALLTILGSALGRQAGCHPIRLP